MKGNKNLILLIIFCLFFSTLFAIEYEWYTQSFPWIGEEGEDPEVVFADLIENDKLISVYFHGFNIFWYDPCDGWKNTVGKIRNDCEYKIKVRKDVIPVKKIEKTYIKNNLGRNIIYVDINGTGDYETIQEGINASTDGDTVLVYPGTYYENINYNGKNITLTSLFLTTQDYSYINSTIINGNQDGSVIRFSLGEDTTAILCGFTITNGYAERGGGLYCSGSNPSLKNLIIIGNIAVDGAGIYCLGSNPIINNITINNNTAEDSGGGLCSGCESCPTLENCILWNNTPQEIYLDIYGSVTVTYSDIQGGWTGEGNISDNPCFADTANGDYSLTWNDSVRSPCIDTGDPNTEWDVDGTPPDMGAIPAITHDYDSRTLTAEGWNWFSFPVLDTLTEQADTALAVLAPILDNMEEVLFENRRVIWWNPDSMAWENEIGDFRSVDGYKIQMNAPDILPISGFLEDPDAVITLEAEAEYGNWIGYFIEHSMKPQDAFSQVWDKLTYIKAQNWTILFDKQQSQWQSICPTVDYGKSYVVGVSEDCSFTWGLGIHQNPYTKSETSIFSYQEQADYMPIFVDSTEAVAGIDEIGVFLGDECIGASVVEGFPVFVPAYIEDEDSIGTKDYSELTFQVATYGKGGKRSIPAFVYNETQNTFVEEPVILDAKSYAIVRLGTGAGIEFPKEFTLYQNYPNPIANSTTISFIPASGVNKSEIKIYNIKGQLVNTIISAINGKSPITNVIWNGKDQNGKFMANGIYFYKLISGEKTAVKKMVLLR